MIDKQADLHLRINVKSVIGKSLTHMHFMRIIMRAKDTCLLILDLRLHIQTRHGHACTHIQIYKKPLVFFRGVKLLDRVNENTSTYVMRLKQALMRLFP